MDRQTTNKYGVCVSVSSDMSLIGKYLPSCLTVLSRLEVPGPWLSLFQSLSHCLTCSAHGKPVAHGTEQFQGF